MARANMSVNFAAKSARSVPRHSKGTAVESWPCVAACVEKCNLNFQWNDWRQELLLIIYELLPRLTREHSASACLNSWKSRAPLPG